MLDLCESSAARSQVEPLLQLALEEHFSCKIPECDIPQMERLPSQRMDWNFFYPTWDEVTEEEKALGMVALQLNEEVTERKFIPAKAEPNFLHKMECKKFFFYN
jgi:hypothetical protein